MDYGVQLRRSLCDGALCVLRQNSLSYVCERTDGWTPLT